MAHSLSAQKRIRQNEKRRLYNRAIKSQIKTAIKKVRSLVASSRISSPEILPQALSQAYQRLDKAVSKGVIHRNKAARLKSRLARVVNKIIQRPSPESLPV